MKRFTCASSLHLLVIFSADATDLRRSGQLLVCGRFEPSTGTLPTETTRQDHRTKRLKIGETVALPVSVVSEDYSQLNRTPTASNKWIIAKQESDTRQGTLPNNTILYVFNSRRQPKWLYEPKSTAGVEHQLIAHVFQRTQCQYGSSRPKEVIATLRFRHPSPRFTLKSSPDSENHIDTTDCGACDSTIDQNRQSPVPRRDFVDKRRCVEAYTTTTVKTAVHCQANQSPQKFNIVKQPRMHPDEEMVTLDDKVLQLTILLFFLNFLPIREVKFCIDKLNASEHSHTPVTRAAQTVWINAIRTTTIASQSMSAWFLPGDHELVRQLITLVLEAVSFPDLRELVGTAFTVTPIRGSQKSNAKIPTKQHFQKRFAQFVNDVYSTITRLLQMQARDSSAPSLSNLVAAVLEIVYGRHQFQPLRIMVSNVLLNRSQLPISKAYQVFTAQLRDTFVTSSLYSPRENISRRCPATVASSIKDSNTRSQDWNRQWIMDAESLDRAVPYDEGGVMSWLFWANLLSVIEMSFSDKQNDRSCFIRSVFLDETSPSTFAPMHLILDGRLRVARMLPNGLSSLAASAVGPWDIGDYVGAFVSETKDELEFQFFAFRHDSESDRKKHDTTSAYCKSTAVDVRRLALTLVMHDQQINETAEQCVVARGSIDQTSFASSVASLQQMSSSARCSRLATAYWVPVKQLHMTYSGVTKTQQYT